MSHLDPSLLAAYNSLVDPHLQSYFSNERIQSHLKHVGLISKRGDIVSENEYRLRLARREHRKHVQHMLAENIVNRAIDMERIRQAETKREFDIVAKAALVNNVKESRKRSGNPTGFVTNSVDMSLLTLDPCWLQTRPKSANNLNELDIKQARIPRIQSAHINIDHQLKYSSKTSNRQHRSRQRSKLSNINRSSSIQNSRSSTKSSDSSSCEIIMVYYGPHTKVDYDHLVFESKDEIIVMQQHCGGENLTIYKNKLQAGDEFTINSHRHSNYPFGLSLYVNGVIDSRISTCCEYKHRHGVKLGGDRGHFAIKSVQGSRPCIKCQFEKQARLKKYAQSPKDKDNENKKSIIIPIPVSDQSKINQTSVKIPVRHTSISNDNYSEDFDGSDDKKQSVKDGYSTDSTTKHSHTNEKKLILTDSKPKITRKILPVSRKESSKKSSSSSDVTPREESTNKTWQIIFHPSNISIEKNDSSKKILLKYSFLSNNQQNESETLEIDMKQILQNTKSSNQYSFPIKFKDIGKPEQIRLKIYVTENDNDDDDDDEDIKWHLDHIELIDPETQTHLIYPCKHWIRPSHEKILQLLQESSRSEQKRRNSASTTSSRSSNSNHKNGQQSPKIYHRPTISSRSSTSSNISKEIQPKIVPSRRISSNQNEESTSRNDQENKVHYRVIIYPSNDNDGEFNPNKNSRIYLRLNNQIKETNLVRKIDQLCPTFESGERQIFELDLIQNINEQPKKLTIGYINSNDSAKTWKLEKIILMNTETHDEIIFPCKESLIRNESDFHAEKTFEIQSQESDNDDDDRHTPVNEQINSPKSNHEEEIKNSKKETMNDNHTNSRERPSFQSMNDDEADYKKIFRKLDPDNELGLGSQPPSPSPKSKTQHEQKNQNSLPRTTIENAQNHFKVWYQTNDDDDEDN